MSGLPSIYDSILADSSKPWLLQVDLQESKKILNEKIKQLTLSLEPLSFEPYEEYAERHWDDYEVEVTTSESESEDDVEATISPTPDDTFKFIKNETTSTEKITPDYSSPDSTEKITPDYSSPDSTEKITPDYSSPDSTGDNEPLSHRRLRFKLAQRATETKKKGSKAKTQKKKKNNSFKERPGIQPYDDFIEEHRRRSTRLIMHNMNEDKRIHVSGRRIKLLKGPKLDERKVPTVKRPYRRSDWLLRRRDRFVPEADFPIIPVNSQVSFNMLVSTPQMHDILQYFGDENGQPPTTRREHIQMVEPGESDEESDVGNSDEELDSE